ncbi:hypothetical protein Scep_010546 [Stephania cephalantha]|uniref:Uncharacterized protein n=1 Tax=Stephania cephalantha TaxID=152367 RepID=A0AAP0JXI0_9MAGN
MFSAVNSFLHGFKFDCAEAVSDRLALLGTSSLQGKRISKVEFLKLRKGVVKLKCLCILESPEKATRFLILLARVSVDWVDALQHSIRSLSFKNCRVLDFTIMADFDETSSISLGFRREVAELYGSEKSLPVVEAHRPLSGLHSIALSDLESFVSLITFDELIISVLQGFSIISHSLDDFAKLQRRRQELTQATPDQLVDDEAVYYNVAGEYPRGRVYGLGSLGRKKRRYANPGASTSQMPEMVPRSEFDSVAEQL